MADNKQLLTDTFTFRPRLIEDNRAKGGKLIASGEFARANLATENKRMYPLTLWEREVKRLAKNIKEGKVFGEADHPSDGRTSIKRISHIITDLHMEGQVMMGSAEILDTQEGRNLKAIIDAGGQLGVSSRGFGTTRPNNEGIDVVQDDYKLMTFDFVTDPANTTSYPSIHSEDKKPTTAITAEAVMEEKNSLEKLRQSDPALYESFMYDAQREFEKKGAEIWAKKLMAAKEEAAVDLKATFAENLKSAIASAKADIAEEEKNKLLGDPSVAAAKSALESVKALLRPFIVPEDVETVVLSKETEIAAINQKLAEAELKIANLATENSQLAAVAKEAGYKFHLERMLSGAEHADLIRKTLGDVKQYESVEALNAKVGEIVDEIKKVSAKHEARDAELDKLRKENNVLREAAEKALAATKQMSLSAYMEERLKHHPRAAQVRLVLEAKGPESKTEIDDILTEMREPRNDRHSLDEARARVRALVGSGAQEYIKDNEEQPRALAESVAPNYNGTQLDVDSLRALSGMGSD